MQNKANCMSQMLWFLGLHIICSTWLNFLLSLDPAYWNRCVMQMCWVILKDNAKLITFILTIESNEITMKYKLSTDSWDTYIQCLYETEFSEGFVYYPSCLATFTHPTSDSVLNNHMIKNTNIMIDEKHTCSRFVEWIKHPWFRHLFLWI